MRVHDSQAYRKMDVTRESISRILELREIILSFQTGFNLVNAAVVCSIEYFGFGTLTPHAENIIAEEQAGFRPGRSTTEQSSIEVERSTGFQGGNSISNVE